MRLNIKVRKETFGGKIAITLKTEKDNIDHPQFKDLMEILNLLKDLWELGNTGASKRLADRIKKIIKKEKDINSIYAELNGPCHHLLSTEQCNNLIGQEQKLIAELIKN